MIRHSDCINTIGKTARFACPQLSQGRSELCLFLARGMKNIHTSALSVIPDYILDQLKNKIK